MSVENARSPAQRYERDELQSTILTLKYFVSAPLLIKDNSGAFKILHKLSDPNMDEGQFLIGTGTDQISGYLVD